ncbi:DUF7662 domain-containing protein [Pseudorhodoplanes sp.]|uniref:DUF7662 domain-containing protein n=1 Tax=Pseudorhodoplanes sp. TaxID=1934341 RepID=UPI003BEECDAC
MSKYSPLGEFLRKQAANEVRLSFSDIERIARVKLPPSARYRAWWSNNPTNSVMTKVWLDAGFETEQVDMAARKLVFKRVGKAVTEHSEGRAGKHPLFGLSKGLLRINPGTDVTKPADPNWSNS